METISVSYLDQCIDQIMNRFDNLDKKLDQMTRNKQALDGDELLDNYDLCMLLNVTKRTIQRYRQKKLISYLKIDGKTYYKKSEVLSFFKTYKKQNINDL